MRLVALLAIAAAIVLGVDALLVPWWHVHAAPYEPFSLGLVTSRRGKLVLDHLHLDHLDYGGVYTCVSLAALFGAIHYMMELAGIAYALVGGARPNTLWSTPRRAHVTGAVSFGLAVAAFAITPELYLLGTGAQVPATFVTGAGGTRLLIAIALGQFIVFALARDSELAPVLWGVRSAPTTGRSRGRRERPMRDVTPGPPAGPGTDPFRDPPASDLEAKLVRPDRASSSPEVDDPSAPEPHLLD